MVKLLVVAILAISTVMVTSLPPKNICRMIDEKTVRRALVGMASKVALKAPKLMGGESQIGCLKAQPGPKCQEMRKLCMHCMLIHYSGPVLRAFTMGDFMNFSEKAEAQLQTRQCILRYNDLELLNKDGTFNFDNMKQTVTDSEDAMTGEDAERLQEIVVKCIDTQKELDEGNDVPAEQSLGGFQQCFFSGVIDACNDDGKDVGHIVSISHAVSSLTQSKCEGVVVPDEVEETWLECMDETAKELEQKFSSLIASMDIGQSGQSPLTNDGRIIGSLRGWFKSMKPDQIVATAMKSFGGLANPGMKEDIKRKMYGYICETSIKTKKCWSRKLGLLESDGKTVNMDSFNNYLTTKVTGWNGDLKKKREEIVQAHEDCFGEMVGESGAVDMDALAMDIDTCFKVDFAMRNCFMPKYVNICGMNNDLTSFVMPCASDKAMEKIYTKVTGKIKEIAEDVKTVANEICGDDLPFGY